MTTQQHTRLTQAERRIRSRNALLESAARGIAQHGYANLSLERVATQAGYTRGALYHQFAGKDELVLAVVGWVKETWAAEVGQVLTDHGNPADALLALARNHAIYCRRDVAAVLLNLRIEFDSQDHPVGRLIAESIDHIVTDCARLIEAGRTDGSIPQGPPARTTADALLTALEAVAIELAGQAPHDIDLAERAVRGVLGLPPH
ncbi:TetR/AcrR family transcriptional regulator [Phytoactinopolyspora limicola]|uniref:TetR/AcrR family transcriptional regulator n=1 Tax=Phytoactinopolyspora limicola TaxID=2715536 RepID=UPI00140D609C|nr:TetR/AcrR family transcriptional regulator [Phytoactinopolyspora limicola]